MARRAQLAAQRALQRECAHLRWLEQHLPHSTHLARCRARVRTLVAQCAALSEAKQKKALQRQRFFLTYASNCRCSVHLTSSVKLVLV